MTADGMGTGPLRWMPWAARPICALSTSRTPVLVAIKRQCWWQSKDPGRGRP